MNNLYEVMTFSEASEEWNLSNSTLRMIIRTGKLKEGIDYRKSGGTWLITRIAMMNLYGTPTKENNLKV